MNHEEFIFLLKGIKEQKALLYLISPSGAKGLGIHLVFVLIAVMVWSCHSVNELSHPLCTGRANVRRILEKVGSVCVCTCARKSRFSHDTFLVQMHADAVIRGVSLLKRHINGLLTMAIKSLLIQT